ncbi:hypothetical protein HDU76_001702 [Blyttiomyces sp. JEL0837]|nr:hypothetical protein HDU76_001702 [Blyttiomyces sp. JEL0837]
MRSRPTSFLVQLMLATIFGLLLVASSGDPSPAPPPVTIPNLAHTITEVLTDVASGILRDPSKRAAKYPYLGLYHLNGLKYEVLDMR